MPFDKAEPNLDSELLDQLEDAESAASAESDRVDSVDFERVGSVEAVFTVNPGSSREPEDVERTIKKVLRRAEEESGTSALDVSIFRNLSAFAVRGYPELIRNLGQQPEVFKGVANQQPDDWSAAPGESFAESAASTTDNVKKTHPRSRSKGSADERSEAGPRHSRG